MKTKRPSRIIAILLVFSLCAAMFPSIVSAEESGQVESAQDVLLVTDDPQTDTTEDPALSVYATAATRNAALISVTNAGHDHYSALNNIRTNLTNCGISEVNIYTGSFATSSIDWHLTNDYNEVFVSRSHGGFQMNAIYPDEQDGTYLLLNDSSNEIRYVSNDSMDTLNLSNLKLALFVGCYTGYGGAMWENLPSVAIWQGARTAIGFTGSINCNEANHWVELLFDLLDEGKTIREACLALDDAGWKYTTMGSYVICGYITTTLTSG